MTRKERIQLLLAAIPNKPVIHETEEERNKALFGPAAHTVKKLKKA